GFANGSGGIDQVIHQDYIHTFHFADEAHRLDLICFLAVLVTHREICMEELGKTPCPFDATYVGRSKHDLVQSRFLEVWNENVSAIHMVNRNVKESLYLIRVQIACHNPAGTGGRDEV